MANTATGPLPPGIYRIVVAGGSPFESQRLTYDDDSHVTVLPAGVDDDPNQEVIYHFHDELDSSCLWLTSSFT
jgi:hypothetical protein